MTGGKRSQIENLMQLRNDSNKSYSPRFYFIYTLVNCWPSPAGDGTCDVNIDYELQSETMELRDVVISIPIP